MILKKLIAGRIRTMIREVKEVSRKSFDRQSSHPLQSWTWGSLRESDRVEVVRLGEYKQKKLLKGYQITLHKIPKLPWKIGYCPKSLAPSKKMLKHLKAEGKKRGVIMIKFEPNVRVDSKFGKELGLVRGRALFTKNTFWLDLTKSEEELLAGMKSKTRYNVRLAKKRGVEVMEDSSDQGFKEYWKLMEETTNRQEFYAHNKEYHLKMWRKMKEAGQAHLFKAVYNQKTLSTWIVFVLNGVLYYPYGASSREHRELMANNLLAWEVIKFGKKMKLKKFDMWGSLGVDPDRNDPWYGFHKFKEGYGGDLVEFVGSWDLVISPVLYWLYRLGEGIRWVVLRTLKKWKT
jgi:lipid II:glycine glycyltransferase (peptidoglycan interpeptide bridge formation enzyme)